MGRVCREVGIESCFFFYGIESTCMYWRGSMGRVHGENYVSNGIYFYRW